MKLVVEYAIDLVSTANVSGSMRSKMSRTKRHRESAKLWLTSVSRSQRIMPKLPCQVTMTRYGIKSLDSDNLENCFKATRDGIACAGSKTRPVGFIPVDDADPGFTWICKQVIVPRRTLGGIPGQSRVKIEIEWDEP